MKFVITNLERAVKVMADDILGEEWKRSGKRLLAFVEENKERIDILIRREYGD